MRREFVERLAAETGIRLRTVECLCDSIEAVGTERFIAASGNVTLSFLRTFCHFWHELALQGVDPQVLAEVAQTYHGLACADGGKPQAGPYWVQIRALEELNLLKPGNNRKGRDHDRAADRPYY